jgi:hypothetical protein
MPRTFALETNSVAPVDRVHAAFGNEAYWLDRLAELDNGSLQSFTVDDQGVVQVSTSFRLLSAELPAIVTKLRRGDWELVHSETWTPVDDGVRGALTIELCGAPLSGRGSGLLTPGPDGSQLSYHATVAVDVPLIGGAIETLIGSQLTTWLRDIAAFTTDWIAKNG